MLQVHFARPGGNEVVSLREEPDPEPAAEQVLVATRFVGVNPLDILQRDGNYPVPPGASAHLPGVEVAGSVVATGSGVTRWRPGDRVMGLVAQGGLADRVLAHETHLLPVPDDMSDTAAAAIPEVTITAYDALVRAGVGSGDSVIIRGVNGGVGIAAYQIAEAMGARPLGVVRSAEMVERVGTLGIRSVVQGDLEPHSAAAVIEMLGGQYVGEDLDLLTNRGRVVLVGLATGTDAQISLSTLLGRRLEVIGTTLRPRSTAEKALLVQDVERHVLPLLAEGVVSLPVEAVYPAERVTDAFDHLGSQGKVGKVLVEFG